MLRSRVRLWVFYPLLIASCSYAFWRGGRDERLCAFIFIAGLIATRLMHGFTASYQTVVWGVLAVDSLMLLALALLAFHSDRFWPLWLTSMQLIEVASHCVIVQSPDVIPWAYRAAITFWSYPMLLMLWLATYRTRLRQTQTGAARYWPNSWLRRLRLMPMRSLNDWFASSAH